MNGAITGVSQSSMMTPKCLGNRELISPIDLAENRVHRSHDRDDVRHLVPGNDMRQHGKIGERRAAPLHAIRLRAAVGNEVTANLAAWPLDARVGLAFRNTNLRHRFEP